MLLRNPVSAVHSGDFGNDSSVKDTSFFFVSSLLNLSLVPWDHLPNK